MKKLLVLLLLLGLAAPLLANDMNNATWNETDSSNNSAPPNGWPAGMQPNQVEPTAQQMMGALKRFWGRTNAPYSSTGSAGAYAVAPANASFPSAYVQGERYAFRANFSSVGGDTLAWNGLPAMPIYKPSPAGMVAVIANDIVLGQMVDLFYDGALNGASGGMSLNSPPTQSIANSPIPTGTVLDFSGLLAPAGYLFPFGQAVSRTTYVTLMGVECVVGQSGSVTSGSPIVTGLASTAALQTGWPISGAGIPGSTTVLSVDSSTQIHISQNANSGSGSSVPLLVCPYGIGDGTTTFNLPDLRGRATFGTDNMGGVAAGRLNNPTAGGQGIVGSRLGATGGEQAHTQQGVEVGSHLHGFVANDFYPDLSGSTGSLAGPGAIPYATQSPQGTTALAGNGVPSNVVPPGMAINKIIKF